jgi:hypothetical protein
MADMPTAKRVRQMVTAAATEAATTTATSAATATAPAKPRKEPRPVLTEAQRWLRPSRMCASLLQSSLSVEHAMPLLADAHDNHDAMLLFLDQAASDGSNQQQLHGTLETPRYMVNLVAMAESMYQANAMQRQLAFVRLGKWHEVQLARLRAICNTLRHGAHCILAMQMELSERQLPQHAPRPWRRRLIASELWWALYNTFTIGIIASDLNLVGVPSYVSPSPNAYYGVYCLLIVSTMLQAHEPDRGVVGRPSPVAPC